MSDRPNVIALLARAGSGKSTAAKHLTERYGFVRMSFATPLKNMAKALWGFSHEQLYGAEKEVVDPRWGITPRYAMQTLGASARRELGEDVWAHALMRVLKGRVVIDDTRHVNEVDILHSARLAARIDLTVVKLVCEDRESEADGSHESEAQVDQVDSKHIDVVLLNKRSAGLDRFKALLDAIPACTR